MSSPKPRGSKRNREDDLPHRGQTSIGRARQTYHGTVRIMALGYPIKRTKTGPTEPTIRICEPPDHACHADHSDQPSCLVTENQLGLGPKPAHSRPIPCSRPRHSSPIRKREPGRTILTRYQSLLHPLGVSRSVRFAR